MTIPNRNRLIVVGLILIGLIAAGTVPVNHTVKGPCILESSGRWYLEHDRAGQLATGWEHNRLETGGEHVLLQFDRPDFIEVALAPELYEGAYIQAGDTVAVVVSREGLGQQRILEAELQGAKAELDLILAGTRPEDIEVARQTVTEAEAGRDALKPEFDRIKSQYESGAATLSQLQEIEGCFQLLEAELRTANAELTALKAWPRPEDIAIARVEIERLERTLESSHLTTGKSHLVVAPTSGKVRLGGESGTLLYIERVDTLAAITVLPESIISWLEIGQNLEIKFRSEQSFTIEGQLDRIDFSEYDTDAPYSGPVGITFIENRNGRLHSGMTGYTRLNTGKHTLLALLQSRLDSR